MPLPNGLFKELRDSRATNQSHQPEPEPPIRPVHVLLFSVVLVLLPLISFFFCSFKMKTVKAKAYLKHTRKSVGAIGKKRELAS